MFKNSIHFIKQKLKFLKQTIDSELSQKLLFGEYATG